eukprot:5544122-Prymnesium_polylepis.3
MEEADAVTIEALFGGDSGPAAGPSASAAATGTVVSGGARRGRTFEPSRQPRGVELRRGAGEGFIAGLHLGVYLAMRVVSHAATSFWGTLLLAPAAMSAMFVPTMAGDEFAMILAASDFVGWYKCPNGHPYSVGNCTMPMQLARCPACNAPIGGQNHSAVAGVTR